jgi:hypothetical protein
MSRGSCSNASCSGRPSSSGESLSFWRLLGGINIFNQSCEGTHSSSSPVGRERRFEADLTEFNDDVSLSLVSRYCCCNLERKKAHSRAS